MGQESEADEVTRLAEEAVSLATEMGFRLDYSEKSMEEVEKALAMLSREKLSERGTSMTVQRFGCYILEVGRRTHGGRVAWWEQRNAPVLVVSDTDFHVGLMTWDKVKGRLAGDEGDNIPFFYEGFAERIRRREPGTSATFV